MRKRNETRVVATPASWMGVATLTEKEALTWGGQIPASIRLVGLRRGAVWEPEYMVPRCFYGLIVLYMRDVSSSSGSEAKQDETGQDCINNDMGG